jgi:hypothetical protein
MKPRRTYRAPPSAAAPCSASYVYARQTIVFCMCPDPEPSGVGGLLSTASGPIMQTDSHGPVLPEDLFSKCREG